jgi:hypothetical protein
MSNTITIELCQEDRDRLDLLSSVLIALGDELTKQRPVTMQMDLGLKPAAPEINHPADILPPHGEPEPIAEPEPAVEPEQPKYTKDDVLAKVQKLATPNSPHREQAKAIVKSYGAKVSDIPEDKYVEVMAKLAELEG